MSSSCPEELERRALEAGVGRAARLELLVGLVEERRAVDAAEVLPGVLEREEAAARGVAVGLREPRAEEVAGLAGALVGERADEVVEAAAQPRAFSIAWRTDLRLACLVS
jgi:hypothetical protein